MHPIERLRALARTHPDQASAAARAAVDALAGLHDDPAGLVVACRRLVDHEPAIGVMWWVCSELLAASDVGDAAWRIAAVLDADSTPETLATELPSERTVAMLGRSEEMLGALGLRSDCCGVLVDLDDGGWAPRRRRGPALDHADIDEIAEVLSPGDVLLVDVLALSTKGWVGRCEVPEAVGEARRAGAEVWGVAGTGRQLPVAVFDALCSRLEHRERVGGATPASTGGYQRHDLALVDLVVGSGTAWLPDELDPGAACAVAPELLRFT